MNGEGEALRSYLVCLLGSNQNRIAALAGKRVEGLSVLANERRKLCESVINCDDIKLFISREEEHFTTAKSQEDFY